MIESFLFTILVYMVAIHVLYLHAKGQGRADRDKKDMGRGAEGVKTVKMAIKWSFFDQQCSNFHSGWTLGTHE